MGNELLPTARSIHHIVVIFYSALNGWSCCLFSLFGTSPNENLCALCVQIFRALTCYVIPSIAIGYRFDPLLSNCTELSIAMHVYTATPLCVYREKQFGIVWQDWNETIKSRLLVDCDAIQSSLRKKHSKTLTRKLKHSDYTLFYQCGRFHAYVCALGLTR